MACFRESSLLVFVLQFSISDVHRWVFRVIFGYDNMERFRAQCIVVGFVRVFRSYLDFEGCVLGFVGCGRGIRSYFNDKDCGRGLGS